MWVDVPTALAIAILASSAPRLAQRRGLTRVLLLGLLGDTAAMLLLAVSRLAAV